MNIKMRIWIMFALVFTGCFAALAKSYGVFSATVMHTDEFPTALNSALLAEGPSLIHIQISPEAITPSVTLSQMRETALKTLNNETFN